MTVDDWIAILEHHRAQGRGGSKVFVVNDEGVCCHPDEVFLDTDGDLILTDDPRFLNNRWAEGQTLTPSPLPAARQ